MMLIDQVISDGINEITPKVNSLDATNVHIFKNQLEDRIRDNDYLLINLESIDFLDSSGLGALIWTLREIESKGGSLRLCNLKKPVIMLLEVVRMHRVFEIYKDKNEATKSWKK
jgi:anti-sigma B factor antagonist